MSLPLANYFAPIVSEVHTQNDARQLIENYISSELDIISNDDLRLIDLFDNRHINRNVENVDRVRDVVYPFIIKFNRYFVDVILIKHTVQFQWIMDMTRRHPIIDRYVDKFECESANSFYFSEFAPEQHHERLNDLYIHDGLMCDIGLTLASFKWTSGLELVIDFGYIKHADIYHSIDYDKTYMYTVLARKGYFNDPVNGAKYLYMAAYCGSFKIWKVIARAIHANEIMVRRCIRLCRTPMTNYDIDEDNIWNYKADEFAQSRGAFVRKVRALYC